MRIIEIIWYDRDKYAINVDKIVSINFDSLSGKINIYTQDDGSKSISNKDMDRLERIYEDILDFCTSTSDPNEIGYVPLLKINIK